MVLSSLDITKAMRPYCIPIKVLKLLKNDIFEQLVDVFNFSFSTGNFPTLLKTFKVIVVRFPTPLPPPSFLFYEDPYITYPPLPIFQFCPSTSLHPTTLFVVLFLRLDG